MRTIRWFAVLALGVGACADPQGSPSGEALAPELVSYSADQNAARASLLAADVAHSAAAATGAAGFLSYLTNDALFLLPRSPLAEGKAAAQALLAAPPFPFAAGMKFSWTPVFADVSVDAVVGYTFGNLTVTDGAIPGLLAQYIAFWRRQGDGNWKVEAWSFSGAGAEPGALPPFFGHQVNNGQGNFGPVDPADEEQVLLDTDAAFSQASVDLGMAEAFYQYADQHAIVLNGGEPDFVIGRKAIFESRQGAPPDFVLSWTPLHAGVGPLGDLGYTVGDFIAADASGQRFGKYLTVWLKRSNGDWKFVQDAGSSSPPPA